MSLSSEAAGRVGKLVALVGDPEVIETQLRLLPPSQKILIQPALPDPPSLSSKKDTFNARTFIRDVHTAFAERTETARAFLQSSTSTQLRLVIQNGGSVSARATCISNIANTIDEDIQKAEMIFNEIVKDGVEGLMRQVVDQEDLTTVLEDIEKDDTIESVEYPTAKAMRAADSLDRETEALQPNSIPNESTPPETPIDHDVMAISVANSVDGMLKKAAFPSQAGDDIVRTVLTVPSRSRRFTVEEKRTTFGPQYCLSTPATASTPGPAKNFGDLEEEDDGDTGVLSPGQESMFSIPPTPAVYAEALLVDIQSATSSRTLRKTQSVDVLHARDSKLLVPRIAASPLKHTVSDYHLRLRASKIPQANTYETLPRTTFVKASQTTIRRSPTEASSTRSNSSSAPMVPPCIYVDRGEDAFSPTMGSLEQPFEPVFPIIEDLIIHLTDDGANALLENVIKSYKEGSYPTLPTTLNPAKKSDEEPSFTATKEQDQKELRPLSCLTAETDLDNERRHEYHPCWNSYRPDIKRQWTVSKMVPSMLRTVRLDSFVSSVEPPTLTQPLSSDGIAEKIIDFTPTNPDNAIDVQNSLRYLLSLHFPAGQNGYSQYHYPVTPEADRLWKPVFRNDQSTIIGNDGRNFDQIIALGCEDGVKSNFFFQISGQVEKLGSKRDGSNRSGKLDIRYLISNAMQNLSVSSPQTPFNPLSNPQTLAALIVPQIETYLAINTSTRLLVLQYTTSHLPTIFALRKLLGSDLLKIGGVLDSLASDPPSMSHPRTPNPLSNEAVSNRAQSQARLGSISMARAESVRANSINNLQWETSAAGSALSVHFALNSKPSISFAKADYLLPSTATDSEISTFLSNIWKCLMEKSAFYTPEPEPKPIIVERPPIPPTPPASSRENRRERTERERERHRDIHRDTDKDSTHFSSYPHHPMGSQSKISRLTGGAATGNSSSRSNYSPSVITTSTARPSLRHRDQNTDDEPSIASTKNKKYTGSIASNKTTNSEKERRRDKEWENFYIGDMDSEDDAYDKMIMGRSGQRIVPEPEIKSKTIKRDKRKALKWLGLS